MPLPDFSSLGQHNAKHTEWCIFCRGNIQSQGNMSHDLFLWEIILGRAMCLLPGWVKKGALMLHQIK